MDASSRTLNATMCFPVVQMRDGDTGVLLSRTGNSCVVYCPRDGGTTISHASHYGLPVEPEEPIEWPAVEAPPVEKPAPEYPRPDGSDRSDDNRWVVLSRDTWGLTGVESETYVHTGSRRELWEQVTTRDGVRWEVEVLTLDEWFECYRNEDNWGPGEGF